MRQTPPIVLAGATGDLGGRIAASLGRRDIVYRALVRSGSSAALRSSLEAAGATLVEVDYEDAPALRHACDGAACVVSALNGLESVILGMQGKLLEAAVAAGVPRFIQRWLAKFGHGYKWNTLPERGTFGVDQE
jgi:uncharacterized protein YbjT (DUF2867 family)